ncbi:MAG: prepilin peptidase [Proteobacteria bacterium]|nr:prepilin peptidase [Pseudomonadota bacterium]
MDVLLMYIEYNPALKAGLFFCLGACVGSFVTALHYRIPRKLNWSTDRSRCTSCHHTLGIRDLVPIASWLAMRGHCRYCGASISPRYPLIEVGFGLLFALISCL